MTPNIKDKLRRAALIHLELLELEKLYGYSGPSPFASIKGNVRLIRDGAWRARITENAFITNARQTKGLVGETILAAPDWAVVEVQVHHRRKLAFNVRDGLIVLHHYESGLWENWFGVDNAGDTTPFIDSLFADESDPRWQAFMASSLAQWPPKFDSSSLLR